ncbi:MAG: hypothetical protein F7C32_01585 [Desulfurococcales archaeon]|nr:hypothetical protein [Desulfurococcales archaeon]
MADIGTILISYFEDWGLLGIFVISLLSNVVPYMTVPYLVFIALYSATNVSVYAKIAAALLGGVGAGLGKTITFSIIYSGRKLLSDEKRKQLSDLVELFRRGIFITLFIFAASPLPDDLFYVPLAIAGYSIFRFFVAVALGKTVITALAVAFGSSVSYLTGESSVSPSLMALTFMLTLAATYVIIKINWNKVMELYDKNKLLVLPEIIMQGLVIVLPFLIPLYREYQKLVSKHY